MGVASDGVLRFSFLECLIFQGVLAVKMS